MNGAKEAFSSQLRPGEALRWSGQPPAGIHLRASDAFFIPFSIMWCSFAIFWEYSAISMAGEGGPALIFVLFGIPFVLIGLYIVFGRFFVDARLRSQTFYGVTSERILIISGLFSRSIQSLDLGTLQDLTLTERAGGGGTIYFGRPHLFTSFYPGAGWPGMDRMATPQFELDERAREVYEIIRSAQRAARKEE